MTRHLPLRMPLAPPRLKSASTLATRRPPRPPLASPRPVCTPWAVRCEGSTPSRNRRGWPRTGTGGGGEGTPSPKLDPGMKRSSYEGLQPMGCQTQLSNPLPCTTSVWGRGHPASRIPYPRQTRSRGDLTHVPKFCCAVSRLSRVHTKGHSWFPMLPVHCSQPVTSATCCHCIPTRPIWSFRLQFFALLMMLEFVSACLISRLWLLEMRKPQTAEVVW